MPYLIPCKPLHLFSFTQYANGPENEKLLRKRDAKVMLNTGAQKRFWRKRWFFFWTSSAIIRMDETGRIQCEPSKYRH